MKKSTIFISHSSMDKNVVTILKEKLLEYTGRTIEIFVSSDGESIPFGKNWLSTIENGLEESSIMFLFITPNSINNLWVSFEAGFGYSNKIRVIPLCFGVSISDLKYPLGMLQGYDLTSANSFNNIISVINSEFSFSHKLSFVEEDFNLLQHEQGLSNLDNDFSKIIYQLYWSKRFNPRGAENLEGRELSFYNLIKFGLAEDTEKFLKNKNIKFTVQGMGSEHVQVNFAGVLLNFSGAKSDYKDNSTYFANFSVNISSFNLSISLSLLKEYFEQVLKLDNIELTIQVRLPYNFRENSQDISALIFSSEEFSPVSDSKNTFIWRNYSFWVHEEYDYDYDWKVIKLSVTFKSWLADFVPDDVYLLLGKLSDLNILFLDEDLLPNQLLEKKVALENMNEAIKEWEKKTVSNVRFRKY